MQVVVVFTVTKIRRRHKTMIRQSVLFFGFTVNAVLLMGQADGSGTRHSDPSLPLLLLDVDNTLYKETDTGIEAQIVMNTHDFCWKYLGLSSDDADALYREFGTTVEGLRRTLWKDLEPEKLKTALRQFYEEVYRDIDMAELLSQRKHNEESNTGYTHAQLDRKLTRQLLKHSPFPVSLASNSPHFHVEKVLKYLGLNKLDLLEVLTPDNVDGYPTKHEPSTFFAGSQVSNFDRVVFLDDSKKNLDKASNTFKNIEPVHMDHGSRTLSRILLEKLGLLDPSFTFNPVRYLESKNVVDAKSIHPGTWNKVIDELRQRAEDSDSALRIVDLGAGRLNILSLLTNGESSRGLQALLDDDAPNQASIQYTAYESNRDLLTSCQEQLLSLGFAFLEDEKEDELTYKRDQWEVRLILRDFDEHHGVQDDEAETPDVIIGCCFADLMEPIVLVPSLIRKFSLLEGAKKPTLLYFPITFAGTTQFLPPRPFETSKDKSMRIPSDTQSFQIYSKVLSEQMGHNLDPFYLIDVMKEHGAALLARGSSCWVIDTADSPILYETMLHFFGSTAGPSLLETGLDGAGWLQRARQSKPTIRVSNVDLLFEIGISGPNTDDLVTSHDLAMLQEIQFTAPGQVTTIDWDIPELGPNDVLIESAYSLISSGTELKVFKGQFEDAALDVNIKGMEDDRMAYPLAYGYCLCGKIVKCGSNVPSDYVGRLAFTFAAHATHVVTHVESLQLVPAGISAEDAVFMPSVETALSLVHDAHLRVGENVAVFGQGLIGLLVTAILKLNHHSSVRSGGAFGTITTFDTIPDRLAISSQVGATQALFPGGFGGPFDVTIEVSGNARALQSAIDSTVDGGRIIVGSWYGNTDVSLKLGMDFHRSHKTLITSQVSELPAPLTATWNKQRRFGLAWELVRDIRPSRLLTKTTELQNAIEAYKALEKGTEVAVAFKY